jgi:pyruvate/2-oxoglutarate dehydrogenase complex dihydrolipoamide acyltransferase (E2) component
VFDKAEGAIGRATEGIVPGTQLLSETTNEAGQTVQRTVDESGDIIETILDESGELVDENIVGNVTELSPEEEYTNEEGNTVRTVKEEGGKLLHLQLGPDGSLLELRWPDMDITEEEADEERAEQYQLHSKTDVEKEPDATDAAKQKAEQLGADLSKIEGTGAVGRITVRDVVQSVREQGRAPAASSSSDWWTRFLGYGRDP